MKDRKGNVGNDLEVKGEYVIQFGNCRGQKFRWLLENAMGYVGWLVNSMSRETTTMAAISQNKAAFKEYVLSFEEGREVVAIKKAEMDAKKKTTSSTPGTRTTPPSRTAPPVSKTSPLSRRFAHGQMSKDVYLAKVSEESKSQFKPTIPPSTKVRPVTIGNG